MIGTGAPGEFSANDDNDVTQSLHALAQQASTVAGAAPVLTSVDMSLLPSAWTISDAQSCVWAFDRVEANSTVIANAAMVTVIQIRSSPVPLIAHPRSRNHNMSLCAFAY